MATMNISLPDAMKGFVESEVSDGGYSTASEYFRELVRDAQKRKAEAKREQSARPESELLTREDVLKELIAEQERLGLYE